MSYYIVEEITMVTNGRYMIGFYCMKNKRFNDYIQDIS